MTPPFPARLHVLLARDANYGVVIRRGPSKSVCTIGWNRSDDSFALGQWLHGRIFERRCDLSPDGRHLLYFALNGRWESEVKGSWTGISRAPYLKADDLWVKGDGWHGGGLFIDNRKYWLNDGYGHEKLRALSALKRDIEYSMSQDYGGECPGVYYLRLQRDGWKLTDQQKKYQLHEIVTFEKPFDKRWVLRKFAHAAIHSPQGKGCYYDEHEIENLESGAKHCFPEWEWAEIDGARLVWARDGKLFAAKLHKDGLNQIVELHDFNDMKFERIKAPY